jgi:hypothetical protein
MDRPVRVTPEAVRTLADAWPRDGAHAFVATVLDALAVAGRRSSYTAYVLDVLDTLAADAIAARAHLVGAAAGLPPARRGRRRAL